MLMWKKEFKEFWKDYFKKPFNKRPRVVKNPFSFPLVTPEETFRAFREACREGSSHQSRLILEVDHFKVIANSQKYLPCENDTDLNAYWTRNYNLFSSNHISILSNGIQADLGWQVFDRIRLFLRGLYLKKGIPLQGTEAILLTGKESKIAGVRKANGDVFLLVIQGKKKVRVWPERMFERTPGILSPQQFDSIKSKSILLEAEPGDLILLPSSCWYLGESEAFTTTISFACHYQSHVPPALSQYFYKYPATKTSASGQKKTSVTTLQNEITGDWLKKLIQLYQLERVSNDGFERSPESNHSPLKMSDSISVNTDFPILLKRNRKMSVIAANGHSTLIKSSAAVYKLVNQLNRGTKESVSDVVKRFTGRDLNRKQILSLLNQLHSWRGIEKTS